MNAPEEPTLVPAPFENADEPGAITSIILQIEIMGVLHGWWR